MLRCSRAQPSIHRAFDGHSAREKSFERKTDNLAEINQTISIIAVNYKADHLIVIEMFRRRCIGDELVMRKSQIGCGVMRGGLEGHMRHLNSINHLNSKESIGNNGCAAVPEWRHKSTSISRSPDMFSVSTQLALGPGHEALVGVISHSAT
ncbi:unnamed protein product [Leptidea sinapis]|uniref:Uncharacterized protein n=1 Tax=Leptidea sinapis TaxID=189913 RepID=A0A5E4R2D5_9NEOP|nr:unnamed protein product [Leptidea sinapis]